jgi:hypothetical protein
MRRLRGKGVRVNLDLRPPSFEVNGDNVEPAGLILQAPAGQEVDRHPDDPLLLAYSNRCLAATELIPVPRLDLHEHEAGAESGNDVNFAVACTVSALENYVPATCQFRTGEIFAQFAERLPTIGGHAAAEVHIPGP